MNVDLRQASLSDLVSFIFDHSAPERDSDAETREWYWLDDLEVEIDPSRQLSLLTEMFRGAARLLKQFSPEQLEQGLWFVFGPGGEDWFIRLIADPTLPWPHRKLLIESIFELYDQLLAEIDLESATFMLWDLLLDQFYNSDAGNHVFPPAVEKACFNTLVRILNLPSPACQHAALHGLGHLRYPGTAEVVAAYLKTYPPTDYSLRSYAERVRAGEDVL